MVVCSVVVQTSGLAVRVIFWNSVEAGSVVRSVVVSVSGVAVNVTF